MKRLKGLKSSDRDKCYGLKPHSNLLPDHGLKAVAIKVLKIK